MSDPRTGAHAVATGGPAGNPVVHRAPGTPRRRARGPRVVRLAAIAVVALAGWVGMVGALDPIPTRSRWDGPLPPCRVADVLTLHRAAGDWARTLVDQELRLAPSDVPADLVSLRDAGIPGTGLIRAVAVDDLRQMARAAAAAGSPFRITSAYRSYAHQARTFASLEAAYGRDEALRSGARPGHSEHQLGTTIDVEGGDRFLPAHAHRFGWIMSYPPEHSPRTTCYKPEPWHFRYVGREAAAAVHRSGESLRGWLWTRQSGP